MSFDRNPPQTYVPWKPNADFMRFFNDLKKRRISAPDSTSSAVRISEKPPTAPPSTSSNRLHHPHPRRRRHRMKHNYSTPSEVLVNTAIDQVGAPPKKKQKQKQKRPCKKDKKRLHKSKKDKLEKRLRKARL